MMRHRSKNILLLFVFFFVVQLGCVQNGAGDIGYRATEKEFSYHKNRADINVKYPCFVSENDKSFAGLNAAIQTYVEPYMDTGLEEKYYLSRPELNRNELDFNAEVEIDYSVSYSDEHFISLVFLTHHFEFGQPYPNDDVHSINYDIVNNKIVTLNDIVSLDNSFINIFIKNAELQLSDELLREVFHYSKMEPEFIAYSFLFNLLEDIDNPEGYVFSYFTPATLEISIGVIHALGSHVEVSIPIEDLESNLIQ